MVRPMRYLLASLLLFGCESCGGSETPGAEQGSSASQEGTENETPVDPGPPPVVQLRGEPNRDGQVEITLENHGDSPVRIAADLTLERAGQPVDGVTLALRPNCETVASECVELIPGAAFHPPAWLGTMGASQCACENCDRVEPGEYRLVARTCNRAHRVEGAPFALEE